jgi:hypothetical protein
LKSEDIAWVREGIDVQVFIRYFIRHKKRKIFHVVYEYYGGDASYGKHVMNHVKMRRLTRIYSHKDNIIPKES